jgi:uncharacterized membrane protein
MTISSKLAVNLVLVLALAGAVAIALQEHREIEQARAEQAALMAESQEAQRLAEENKGITALRDSNTEAEKLREQNKDLPALRNDARQLRRAAADLEKLRAENQQLLGKINAAKSPGGPGAVPAGFIPRAAMQDVGASTPEAAVQTFLWAMTQGNLERLAQLTGADGPPMPLNAEQQKSRLSQEAQNFPGFAIAEKNIISADEVEIGLQTSMGGTIAPIKLRRVDNEWKVDVR